jgi:hypothetical protein
MDVLARNLLLQKEEGVKPIGDPIARPIFSLPAGLKPEQKKKERTNPNVR